MRLHLSPVLWCVVSCLMVLLLFSVPSGRAAGGENGVPELESVPADQVDTVLARLSDEQVRELLIRELRNEKRIQEEQEEIRTGGGLVSRVSALLHSLDDDEDTFVRHLQWAKLHILLLPADLHRVFLNLAPDSTPAGAWKNIALVFFLFLVAFLVEVMFSALTRRVSRQFEAHLLPDLKGGTRFWAAFLHNLPAFIHLAVFCGLSLLFFFFMPGEQIPPLRYLFMALLFVFVAFRLVRRLSLLFLAPDQPGIRLLPFSDQGAVRLHNSLCLLTAYIIGGVALLALLEASGLAVPLVSLVGVGLGSFLLLLIAVVCLINRRQVAQYILSGEKVVEGEEGAGWLMRQLAATWHLLVFGYLLVVWGFLLYNEFSGVAGENGAFLFSLFLLPLFMVLDRVAGWVVLSVVKTLRIYDTVRDPVSDEEQEEARQAKRKEARLVIRIRRVARVMIVAALGVWMLSFWGFRIPHAQAIVKAVFDILVTLALALIFWRMTSNYIERKIQEATPEEEENNDTDDEWGAATTRGRGYTLYPMVRKFIGTVLVVMVTLIILSSLGVDIGPLLAGAGVVGLAIGFGAQKLVADVFSGFFYLLDDAFRVGEYLEAGSVSGAVENITLRNVMLRHHRGMLQIVPYSELGPITNYMRGGIVVKFNLEFPYDADIDKIRKIIKKTGRAMLEDPEFGKDFIRPVKSQGVREITNSVMVIRVKFTAQPGTHFVIRREAYRRITENLAKAGIHYAHRKVIVELPKDGENETERQKPTAAQMERALEAGAAAAQEALNRRGETGRKENTGMPDM